jgi:hypothetical protein
MDGQSYCALNIPSNTTHSLPVDGAALPVLRAGKQIGLNVQTVGKDAPGSDLTVVIRV